MKRTNVIISLSCAVLLIVSSIALAFIQAIGLGDIQSGVLMYIAQAFLLAGSLFGLDYYRKTLLQDYDKNTPRVAQ